ncbi:MAG: hypothetical protein ACRDO7_02215 [Nocardioidaceae bacterium]
MKPLHAIGIGLALVGVLAVPAAAAAEDPGWLTPQSVEGTGRFTMHGPGVEGDRIRFAIDGRTARTGLTNGGFSFRHHSPATADEPAWTSHGYGRVICLSVSGDTALLTAAIRHEVVPGRPEGNGPHAFYLKITDGRRDHVSFIQGPPPPAGNSYGIYGCSDPETIPDIPIDQVDRYFLRHGGWRLRGPDAPNGRSPYSEQHIP